MKTKLFALALTLLAHRTHAETQAPNAIFPFAKQIETLPNG